MSPEDFEKLQVLMASRAGYRLTRDRINLATHRLGPVARREGYDSVEALLEALWAKPVASLGWAVIEALLNPETWFFRDRSAFHSLGREILPAIAARGANQRISIWSAGCGAGQEVWSLALTAHKAGVPVEVIGTDLNARSLEKARQGTYTGFEIQRGLAARAMLDGFEQSEDLWSARPALRDGIRFARANLLDPPTDAVKFDIIFCRHVLVDTDPAKRGQLVDNLAERLKSGGLLFLAPDESPEGDSLAFRAVAGRKGMFVKAADHLIRAA